MIKRETLPVFWTNLKQKSAQKRQLLTLTFELTYRCNLHCQHCYIVPEPRKRELKNQEVLSILDELEEMGCLEITFTGGEIFCRSDTPRILSHARKKGFIITILTNGTFLTEKMADFIRDLSCRVEITINGATSETYEEITQVPGSFGKCLKAIERMKRRKVDTTLKMLVTRQNRNELHQVQNLADRLRLPLVFSFTVQPKWKGPVQTEKFQLPPEEMVSLIEDYYKYFKNCLPQPREGGVNPYSREVLFHCSAGKNSAAITPYGEMKPCVDLPFPLIDLQEVSVAQAWRKLAKFIASTKPVSDYPCPDCELGPYCNRCPADGWLYGRNFNICIPRCRNLAKVKKIR